MAKKASKLETLLSIRRNPLRGVNKARNLAGIIYARLHKITLSSAYKREHYRPCMIPATIGNKPDNLHPSESADSSKLLIRPKWIRATLTRVGGYIRRTRWKSWPAHSMWYKSASITAWTTHFIMTHEPPHDPASCVRGMYKWRRRPRRGRAGDGIHQSQMTELISCASMTITRDERGVSKSQNVTCKLPKRISISERRGQHWVWRITGT